MDIGELRPNRLVQNGIETLKIHMVFPPYVTAELVVPVPPDTAMRYYAFSAVARWRPVTDDEYARYAQAYDVGVR